MRLALSNQVASKMLFHPCLIEHFPLSLIKNQRTRWNKASVKGE